MEVFFMMTKINTKGSYEFNFNVVLEKNIFDPMKETDLKNLIEGRKVFVVISKSIKKHFYSEIDNYFKTVCGAENFKLISIKTGEKNKTFKNVIGLLEKMLEFKLDRKAILAGIGGGALLDVVGFAASVYRRGIDYIRVPTTLLSQIDVGIGIKTGVNHLSHKNIFGSFYPPILTINDQTLMKTLPQAEVVNGLSEILKMAVLIDERLFELIEDNYFEIFKTKCQTEVMEEINIRAITSMRDMLETNFYERNTLKRLPDFGHTFSPFIESASGFKISHGRAVAIDMAVSAEIAFRLNLISKKDRDRIYKLFLNLGLEIYNEVLEDPAKVRESMKNVVLHRGGNLNLVIPYGIGVAGFIEKIDTIPEELLYGVITELKTIQGNKSMLSDEQEVYV
jgi:2-epi-5-epi-valiolone synthase